MLVTAAVRDDAPPVQVNSMRAVTASAFGQPSEVLRLREDVHRPSPDTGLLLIRTMACSLSPGDWRMLSGDGSLVKYPANGFPYVPGLDVSGEVVEAVPPFEVGDQVVATWSGAFGAGGLAEYALIDPAMTVRKPQKIGYMDAAALANSAGHALKALRAAGITHGDRVLILGGSGGVGTAAVQLARANEFGASFVAATSSDTALLMSLGVDRAINYHEEEWWRLAEFVASPFDVVIDCAEGVHAWRRVSDGRGVLKSGGRFLAVVLNEWHIEATRWWHMFGILLPPLGRSIGSSLGRVRYAMYLGSLDASVLTEVMDYAEKGALKPIKDPGSPFPLSTAGAIAAFDLLRSRHAKGKVVVEIGRKDETETVSLESPEQR